MILRECSILMILLPLIINILEVEGVDVTGDVSQQCEQNVDAKVHTAPGDQEHPKRREKNLIINDMDLRTSII